MTRTVKSKFDHDEMMRLIERTDMQFIEIASYLEITPSMLTHTVKKRTGMLPSEYRIKLGWLGSGQRALSPSRVGKILAMYDKGASMSEVAAALRTTTAKVHACLETHGREIREGAFYLRKNYPEAEIAARYQAGENTVELGRAYNCDEHSIRRVLDRQGVPRRADWRTRR